VYRLTVEYDTPADPAAFETRYTDEHVPLVQQSPGLRRFTLSHPKGGDGTPYLVAELWWDDEAAFNAYAATPERAATMEHAQRSGATYRTFHGEVDDQL
jgi:uncharacterized protein (TIGR02118 family)